MIYRRRWRRSGKYKIYFPINKLLIGLYHCQADVERNQNNQAGQCNAPNQNDQNNQSGENKQAN